MTERPDRPWGLRADTARQQLIATIDATGGIDWKSCPLADPEWLDLGLAYRAACDEEGVEPFVEACDA